MHNPPANPQKCYNEARDLEIKSHWNAVRSHQIAKHNPHFRLQQHILRKQCFFEAGKGKGSRRQKNIYITNHITKFLVPSFNKYCRNEISTRYQQCRRQTKRFSGDFQHFQQCRRQTKRLAVADFKNYEVADLRLPIQES